MVYLGVFSLLGAYKSVCLIENSWLKRYLQGCSLIFFGRLADLYGQKKVFLAGTTWLCIFALACSFVKDVITLNVLRALQGFGPAAYIPASVSEISGFLPSPQLTNGSISRLVYWRQPFHLRGLDQSLLQRSQLVLLSEAPSVHR